MSYPYKNIAGQKTTALVERARGELDKFKSHVAQIGRSDNNADPPSVPRVLIKQIQQAELMVEKAEKTAARIKTIGKVPQRPTASVPASVRAKRALTVLLAGTDLDKTQRKIEKSADGNNVTNERNVRQKISDTTFLSSAGKPSATPIRDEDLNPLIKRLSKETEMTIQRVTSRGVGIECRNVFRAFIWFKDVSVSSPTKRTPGQKPSSYVVPEHVGCFRVDESRCTKWAYSEHAIFHVMTERANAAIRYFQVREETGEAAFTALVKWLAKHKQMFNTKCEDRRLAFDASRGIFLPACIFSFEGNGSPRFTRGTIPRRQGNAHQNMRIAGNPHAQRARSGNASSSGNWTGQAVANASNDTRAQARGRS